MREKTEGRKSAGWGLAAGAFAVACAALVAVSSIGSGWKTEGSSRRRAPSENPVPLASDPGSIPAASGPPESRSQSPQADALAAGDSGSADANRRVAGHPELDLQLD